MAEKLIKNRLIYLNNLANIFPNDDLKPIYRARLSQFENESDIKIELKKNRNKWCPQCLSEYKKTSPKLLIKPPKKIKQSDTRILSKNTLTMSESKYKKYLTGHLSQKLISHCTACGHILSKDVEKPPKIKIIETPTLSDTPILIKSSKKKKHDVSAGLNYEAVLSAMTLNSSSNNKKMENKIRMKLSPNAMIATEKKLNKTINKKKLKNISNALGLSMNTPKSKGLKSFLSALQK